MIPLENRTYLLKKLKEGMDIRNGCIAAKISRSTLYKYFKEDPEFKDKVNTTIAIATSRKEKSEKMKKRRNLMHVKETLKNRK